ncbi:MAG: circularly permuted type 2 ATP-grasp protein [Pirellulaceae bacterium]
MPSQSQFGSQTNSLQPNPSESGSPSVDAFGNPLPILQAYDSGAFFDELVSKENIARQDAAQLVHLINSMGVAELSRRQSAIEHALYRMGITFTVYSDTQGTEKIMPFDVVPRIVSADLWSEIDAGLQQRIRALNRFLDDVYNERKIIAAGLIPAELVESASGFLPQCLGLRPPKGVWCHITGTDLVRDNEGKVFVLEDNLRCPSGVSYVLQNRHVMKRNFPQVFRASRVRPVADYPSRLYSMLRAVAPEGVTDPTVAVLTPGVFNSAYYEHSFLAQQMGAQLVEGRDLVVQNTKVYMRTTAGLKQVDVIYRRVDDTFIDPETFRKDSMLGVAGLMKAYQAGNVTLANAPGTGVADDKVIYAFVPKMIEFYLGEEPILNNVPTYICSIDSDRQYVLSHLDELVVKAAAESGGYGIMIGPHASESDRAEFAEKIRENPRNWIAQPTLQLSRVPTIVNNQMEGRHVDLRPYILCSAPDDVWVLPGGLTRVALRAGSLVVNSSQGGGSKDTWVAADENQQTATR